MLYSLAHIETFLVLLIALALAWAVHVGAQRLVQSRMSETKWLLQRRPGAAGFVDPFSAVAAILGPASSGWTPPVEWSSVRGSKRPFVTLLLAGPLANLLVGAGCLIGFYEWVGPLTRTIALARYGNSLGDFVGFAQDRTVGVLSNGLVVKMSVPSQALLLIGLVQFLVAVISLIPLPPLEGGRLLFLFTPKSIGWQKAEYQLAERNIGLIILLVGLIRISSGWVPPFAYLADVISHGLAVALSHV